MGTVGDYPNVGVSETAAQAEAGLVASAAAAAAYEADAHRFITEHGAAVVGGHAPVGLAEANNVGADPDTGGMDASDS